MNRHDTNAEDVDVDLVLDHRKRSRSMTSIEQCAQESVRTIHDLGFLKMESVMSADGSQLRLKILGVKGNKVVIAAWLGNLRLKDKILEEGDEWAVKLTTT